MKRSNRVASVAVGVSLLASLAGCENKSGDPVGRNSASPIGAEQSSISIASGPIKQEQPMSMDEAIKTLKKLGGVVEMNIRDGDLKVTAINLSDPMILDADLVVLKSFPDVEIVRLSGTSVTDACVPTLKTLARLRSIEVNGTQISNAGLGELKRHFASRVLSDAGGQSPARRDHFARQLTWEATEKAERTADNWVVYKATVDGIKWTVRMNDFPAEPLYTLLIDGNETVDFNNWPESWKRPVESKKK